jgi:hypothetical protein
MGKSSMALLQIYFEKKTKMLQNYYKNVTKVKKEMVDFI